MTIGRKWAWAVVAMAGWAVRSDAQEKITAPWPQELVGWAAVGEGEAAFTGRGEDDWDRKIRERGWIIREGDGYRLWYTGYNEGKSDNRFLGHATSTDGVHWKRDPGDPLVLDSWVEDMCVVKHDGTYQMFAEGRGDIAHRLTSTDGLHWEEQGPLDVRKVDGTPISAGPYGTPTAWFEDGEWKLLYERGDLGIWLATSKDLKTWTNVRDDPVIPMGPDEYDLHAVAVNQVLKLGDVYYATYHANSTWPWGPWTTCLARSTDLVHWEKYPGNPIVSGNRSSGIFVDDAAGKLWLYTMHPDVRRHEPRQAKPATETP